MADPASHRVQWQPLTLSRAPADFAQPEMPAIAAFWRRVTADLAAVDPPAAERLARTTRHAGGMGEEIALALAQPLSIRMLQDVHVLATRDQTAARVVLNDGTYRYVPFPYGKLKDKPNHLIVSGRSVAEFCPPEDVVPELEKLVRVHDEIPAALLDVRAAWLLYAFLRIHPFADGNGRVARLLASWDFVDAGLPPVWGESSDRGAGWGDSLDAAAETRDLTPLAALLAGHEARQVARLLVQMEGAPPEAPIDEVLAHHEAMAALSARWADHRRVVPAQLAALLERARARLEALAPRLRGAPQVRAALGSGWAHARDAGLVTDRRVPGAGIGLRSGGVSVWVRLAALGTSGSGAWTAFVTARPRAAFSVGTAPLTLFPEERSDARAERFSAWLDRSLGEALGFWQRMV